MNTTDSNNEAKAKIIALFGGTSMTVNFEDATTGAIRVRQLRMSEYEKALPFIGDEIAITAFFCSMEATPDVPCVKNWAMTLHPKSYEQVRASAQEVNKEGFFIYAARMQEQEKKTNEQWIRMAAELPPEILKTVTELGKLASPTLSPRPRPIPR